jgi:methylated-DNA-[protein]-cysteine S-methyltransferase
MNATPGPDVPGQDVPGQDVPGQGNTARNDTAVLEPLTTVPTESIAALRARLADDAEQAHLLDVAYRTVDTPVGTLLLAATEEGLVRIAYGSEDHDLVLGRIAREISPRILAAPRRLDPAARQLAEYFTGRRRSFDLPLDLRLAHGFRRLVLGQLTAIAYGHTASYATIAAAAGSPKAVRAVGTACATNPLPVVVPCHRVVRADGAIGRYVGGADAKRTLLSLESAA